MRQEYSSATFTVGGRSVGVVGTVRVETHSREHREAMRPHATSATISMRLDSAAADDLIRLFRRANGVADVDELDEVLAAARRPVIRDQGPPPVRRQPAPRRMRPPARQLSWLVEGRGR